MLLSKARLYSAKKLKTLVKLTFHVPLDVNSIQLLQSVKVKGYLAFNPDQFKKEVEELLMEISPITNKYKHNGTEYINEILRFEDLPIHEAVEHIDYIKEWAAINLHVYIPNSITINT